MQLLQIDFTPAIVVLGIGCLIGVGLKIFQVRVMRQAEERITKLSRESDEPPRSHSE